MNQQDQIINGHCNPDGAPRVKATAQALTSGNPNGDEGPVELTVATGARITLIGTEDARRLGITPPEPARKPNPNEVYWNAADQPLWETQLVLRFQGTTGETALITSVHVVDHTSPQAGKNVPSYLGMNTLQGWTIEMNPNECIVHLTPPRYPENFIHPQPKHSPNDEPKTLRQAFNLMSDNLGDDNSPIEDHHLWDLAQRHIGLNRIPHHFQDHQAKPIHDTVAGIEIRLHTTSYLSVNGRIQLWVGAVDAHTPQRMLATGRFSWADHSDAGIRCHNRLMEEMKDIAHARVRAMGLINTGPN